MKAVAERFGRNVAYVRRLRGLSQEELSFLAALHRTEISQVERGLRLARIDTLAKLCGALRVTPDELMDGIAWTPSDPRLGHFSTELP